MSLLLSPITIGNLNLKNRVVMAPMCMYEVKKEDGIVTPFHFAHYGARAIANVGLIIIEATAVQPDGRITKHDLGLWDDSQTEKFTQLVDSLCNWHMPDAKLQMHYSQLHPVLFLLIAARKRQKH